LEAKEIEYGSFEVKAWCSRCQKDYVIQLPLKTKETAEGYIRIRIARLKPFFSQSMIPEHRYVWERIHGRLSEDYLIHHINGIKADNRIENLVAMPKASHNSHLQGRDYSRFQIVCPSCHAKFLI